MESNINALSFNMKTEVLRFDIERSIILCQSKLNNKKRLWIKKLNNSGIVIEIIEDNENYYVSLESGEINGQFLALNKKDGSTNWFIPGKSFLRILLDDYLFLIFSDETGQFYLIKVDKSNGQSEWFHPVNRNLKEYSISKKYVNLIYSSGKIETLSINTGRLKI